MARKIKSQSVAASLAQHAKGKKGGGDKKNKNKKYGRNRTRCLTYRMRVGKPHGRGMPGNKRGKNAS
jgi:hypothetical protein